MDLAGCQSHSLTHTHTQTSCCSDQHSITILNFLLHTRSSPSVLNSPRQSCRSIWSRTAHSWWWPLEHFLSPPAATHHTRINTFEWWRHDLWCSSHQSDPPPLSQLKHNQNTLNSPVKFRSDITQMLTVSSEANMSDLFRHGPERQRSEDDGLVHSVEPPSRWHLLHDNIVG